MSEVVTQPILTEEFVEKNVTKLEAHLRGQAKLVLDAFRASRRLEKSAFDPFTVFCEMSLPVDLTRYISHDLIQQVANFVSDQVKSDWKCGTIWQAGDDISFVLESKRQRESELPRF